MKCEEGSTYVGDDGIDLIPLYFTMSYPIATKITVGLRWWARLPQEEADEAIKKFVEILDKTIASAVLEAGEKWYKEVKK